MSELFCNYCPCEGCQYGEAHMSTAKTENGRICDICYLYECCVNAKNKIAEVPNDPCEDKNCEHRPKIIGEWANFDKWKKNNET